MSESKKMSLMDKCSFFIFLAVIFLTPLFFIPGLAIPIGVSKGILLSVGVTLSFIFWMLARLIDGVFVFPRSLLMSAVLVFPFIFLLASIASPNFSISMFGYGFEIGTFSSILIFSLGLFLAAIFFQDKTKISYFFLAIFGSFALISIFSIANLIFNFTNLAPSFFVELSSSTLVGGWNDFGAFSGLVILISLLALELLPLRKPLVVSLWVFVFVGLIFMAIVNFFSLFMIVGVISLIIFVYSLSISKEPTQGKKFPLASFIVVVFCLIFLIANNFLGGFIPNFLGISNIEIRPSVQSTIEIAHKTLSNNIFFGGGPNYFNHEWALFKPANINNTIFWNSNFNSGFSLVLSFLVTTGAVGFIVFVLFIGYFFFKGITSSIFLNQDKLSTFLSFGSFILPLYLWILTISYVPNVVLLSFAFISTGVFVGVLVNRKEVNQYNFSFLRDPRTSFFSILFLVLFMFGMMVLGYGYVKRFISVVFFEKSLSILNQEKPDYTLSESKMLNAINLNANDLYYRSLSEIYLARLSDLLLSENQISEENLRTELQNVLSKAEESARLAVTYDSSNYLNWSFLGSVYRSIVPLGVDGAYQNSKSAYEEAIKRNPKNPNIYTNLARLEVVNENNTEARRYINIALEMKQNYLDAYYLLAGLSLSENNINQALSELEKAVALNPTSQEAYFQLGLLRYNNNKFNEAVSAFERAVIINPGYVDARYLLALSYDRSGKRDRAKIQFEILSQVFPDNQDIKNALSKIENNQSLIENSEQFIEDKNLLDIKDDEQKEGF